MQLLTYKYRLLPTKGQHRRLAEMLEHTRRLYNLCLEHRLGAWDHACRWERRDDKGRIAPEPISTMSQQRDLTAMRRSDPAMAAFPRRLQCWAINLLDDAFKGFYTLRRNGRKDARRPGFRGRAYWNTFALAAPVGCELRGRYLRLPGMASWLRVGMDRPLPVEWDAKSGGDRQTVKTIKLIREDRRWFVHVTVAVEGKDAPARPRKPVGVDLGLKALAVLSDGFAFKNPRISNRMQAELRIAARTMDRRTVKDKSGRPHGKQSRRRLKAKLHLAAIQKKAQRRRDAWAHKVSKEIVRRFDGVAVEKLNVKGLAQLRKPNDGKRGRSLRRNVLDAAFGQMLDKIEWKAKRDGRLFVRVDPKGTTQNCSSCGLVVPKTLFTRVHDCPACGLVMDRDQNAALNVLHRAGWGPGGAKREAASAAGSGLSRKQPRVRKAALCDHAPQEGGNALGVASLTHGGHEPEPELPFHATG